MHLWLWVTASLNGRGAMVAVCSQICVWRREHGGPQQIAHFMVQNTNHGEDIMRTYWGYAMLFVDSTEHMGKGPKYVK